MGFFEMWDAAIREMIAINAFNFFLFGKAEMSPSLLPTLNCTHLLSTHTLTQMCGLIDVRSAVRKIKTNAHEIKRTSEISCFLI